MPTFEITGPDGKKYRVTGESADGALAALQDAVGGQAKDEGPAIPQGFSDVWTDEMLFGFPSVAAAGMNAAIRAPFTDKSIGEEYTSIREAQKRGRKQYADEAPVRNALASIGGGIMGAGKLMGAGATATRLIPAGATGLGAAGANIAANAADGAIYGGLSALGHGEDIGQGAGIGAVLGGAAYPVVQAAKGIGNFAGGILGIGNQGRANEAVVEAMRRANLDESQIAAMLDDAARAGQPEYMVADALGNPGQRMLSGVARSPGDMRTTIADTLQARQAGQGERLVNALSEGFAAPQTAQRTGERLTAARASDAARNYGAARAGAGTVDPTEAIRLADDFLQPGASSVFQNATNIADDSVESAVRRARGYLTDGNSVLRDFNASQRAKMELDAMIEGAKPSVQRVLIPIRNALDDALSNASPEYAAARDAYRSQSKIIDALETGKGAASARTRATDNVRQFGGLSADEQKAFRVGYADPLIARVEAASTSPTTNKARLLQTGKSAQEFPAFAAPGQSEKLGDRIAREQRMFETANAALGGSKTADNLADLGEMSAFDPSMIGSIASGNFKGAIIQALTKGTQTLQGRNSQTRDLIAKMLLETSPTQATANLAKAVKAGERLTEVQEKLVRALLGGSVPVAGGAFN